MPLQHRGFLWFHENTTFSRVPIDPIPFSNHLPLDGNLVLQPIAIAKASANDMIFSSCLLQKKSELFFIDLLSMPTVYQKTKVRKKTRVVLAAGRHKPSWRPGFTRDSASVAAL
jgi:hypothetical protein